MSKLSPHSHSGHHGTDLMGGKRGRAAESRGLALTQGLRVSRGLGSGADVSRTEWER